MAESGLSPGVKRLRKIVIIMGITLVIGTIALFVAACYKITHKQTAPATNYAMQTPEQQVALASTTSEKCSFKAKADIEVDSNIISSSLSGNILTIITGKEAKPLTVNKLLLGNSLTLTAAMQKPTQQIVIFDLCKGAVLSRLNVVDNN